MDMIQDQDQWKQKAKVGVKQMLVMVDEKERKKELWNRCGKSFITVGGKGRQGGRSKTSKSRLDQCNSSETGRLNLSQEHQFTSTSSTS